MGSFYTNITLMNATAFAAMREIVTLGRDAFVADVPPGCVVYDRHCETQDTEVLAALAERLASRLDALALAVLNHDDDVLWLQLYDRADLVTEYSNSGGPTTRVRALCRTLGRPSQAFPVWFLLHRPFVFQVSRHRRLVRRLGLAEAAVGFGFTYLERGESPPGLAQDRLVRVGR